MANLKDIKARIGSVKKTRQITSRDEAGGGAKLKSATDRATAAQPYQDKLKAVLGRVGSKAGGRRLETRCSSPARRSAGSSSCCSPPTAACAAASTTT